MNIAYAIKYPMRPLSDGKMGASAGRAARIMTVLEVMKKLGIKS